MRIKNVLNVLLFCGLTAGALSTVVSCKDYDDDISSLQTQCKENADALAATKAALESEISSLKTQLATTNAELATAKENISKNASDIATNAGNIATNTSNIAENAKKIVDLTTRVSTLETKVANAEQAIKDLQALMDTKVDKDVFEAAKKDIYAQIAAVNEKVAENLKSIQGLEKGLADEETARKAMDKDLQEQIDALKKADEALEKALNEVKGDVKELKDAVKTAQDEIKTLQADVKNLKERVAKNEEDIATLKEDVKKLGERLTKAEADILTLNVFIQQALRSLVFVPDYYYWGIEATTISTVDYAYWKSLPATNAVTIEESTTFDPCKEYPNKAKTFRVENFSATYHVNPSTADLSKMTLKVLDEDKDFTRASAAKLYIDETKGDAGKGFDYKNGDLTVYLGVTNPEKVKEIAVHCTDVNADAKKEMVTVFATEATIPNTGVDKTESTTTVTSDYAAVRVQSITDGYTLCHVHSYKTTDTYNNKTIEHVTDIVNNTTCGDCALYTGHTVNHKHLWKTVNEAGKLAYDSKGNTVNPAYLPQDECFWDETLDLRQLVEIHYTTAGNHKSKGRVSDEAVQTWLKENGYKVVFELTGLQIGDNETSESVHASINPADGYTFRPQMPKQNEAKIGEQLPYGATQSETTVGKRPLVRVYLQDAEGRIFDYGYICIEIIKHEPKDVPVVKNEFSVNYNAGETTWTDNWCADDVAKAHHWENNWIQTEYDLYHSIYNTAVASYGISKEEFEANYSLYSDKAGYPDWCTKESLPYATAGATQYEVKVSGNDTTYVKVETEAKRRGTFDITYNAEGQTTYLLTWDITKDEAYNYFVANKEKKVVRAIRFQSKDIAKYPDIYVVFTLTVKDPVAANAPGWKWDFKDGNKLSNYWYTKDTNVSAQNGGKYDEIHLNVYSLEDYKEASKIAKHFELPLAAVFEGNKILTYAAGAFTIDSNGKNITKNNVVFDLIFSKNNVGKTFTGESGKKYTLKVSADGKTLQATNGGKTENIAFLEYDTDVTSMTARERIDHIKLRYAHIDDNTVTNDVDNPDSYGDTEADTHPDAMYLTKFAYDLLNYHSHKEIAGTLEALIAVHIYADGVTYNNENCFDEQVDFFPARFLRPLNIISSGKEIEDAANATQIITLFELMKFNDWREYPVDNNFNAEYWKYYNIKRITVSDAVSGQSINDLVYTNLGITDATKHADHAQWRLLGNVSQDVELTYYGPVTEPSAGVIADPTDAANNYGYGYIKYTNNGANVYTFDIDVPVTVTYWWGQITDKVTVHIKGTHENNETPVKQQ